MIRFDGYYLEEPNIVINGRVKDNPVSFAFVAFAFERNNFMKIRTKRNNKELLSDFTEKDFTRSEVGLDKNFIIKDKCIHIPKQKSYEGDIFLDIINSEELFNRVSKRHLRFISWEELDKAKAPILLSIFGSLENDSFEKYYE